MAQWWVIAFTSYGNSPSYEYVEGTRAQAEAKAKLAVEVSTKPNITGPFPTKAAAEAAVKAGKANTPNTGPDGIPNPLSGWTHNIEQWLVRGFEMLLGLGLIVVAVAKLASNTSAGKAAVKAGKAAAIL